MASWDNVGLPNAPQALSYGAPQVDFSAFGNLGNQFFKSADDRQKYDVSRTFQEGLPKDANGNIDFRAAAEMLAKRGAIDQIIPLANLDLQRQGIALGQQAAGQLAGGGGSPGSAPAPAAPAAMPAPRVQPVTNAGAGDQSGSMIDLVSQQGIPPEQAGFVATRLAGLLKVDPNAPLTPQQQAQAASMLASRGQGAPAPAGGAPAAPTAPAPAPVTMAAPGIPAAPGAASEAGTPASQAGAVPPSVAAVGGQGLQNYMRATGKGPGDYVGYLRGTAAALKSTPGAVGASEAYEKRANDIQAALHAATEPTGAQKEATAEGRTVSGQKAHEEQTKSDITHYEKLYSGLSGMGTTAAQMLPNIQNSKSLMSQPGFYSGIGENINLLWKRAAAAIGGDPNAALPQEAFRKVQAANLLHQVEDLKAAALEIGGSSSRLFQQQITTMEKAAQNPDNSIAANRYLAELGERAAMRNITIANMASDYKQQHGRLDPGFEKSLRTWMQNNPMFTKEEMADPRIIAAPTFNSPAEMKAAGLTKGTPFRLPAPIKLPDGRMTDIGYAP